MRKIAAKGSIAKAYIQVVPTTDGISSALGTAMGGAGSSAGKSSGSKFASAFKSFIVTAGLGKALSATLMEGSNFQQSFGGMEKIFDEMDTSKIARDAANAYKTLGMSANQYLSTINSVGATFASTMGDEKGYNTAVTGLTAISDFASGTGASVDELAQKYTLITRSASSYQSIADQFSGILPQTSKDFLKQAQAAGFLQKKYDKLTEVPVAEYQAAVSAMLKKGVADLGLAGNTMAEAETTFSGSLAAMKASFSNVLADLSLGNDLKPSLKALTDTVVVFGKNNLLPALKNILSAVPVMLTTLIVGLGPEIAPAALEIISALCDGLITNLPSLIPGVVGIALGIVELLTAPDTIGQLLNAAVGIILALADGLIQSLPLLIERIPVIIENVVQSLLSGSEILFMGATELFYALVQAIPMVIPLLVESIPIIVENIANGLIDNLPLVIGAGIQLLFALNTGILDALPDLLAMLPEIIAAVVQTIGMLLPQVLQIGVQLLVSFSTGIMSYIGDLIAKVKDVGGKVIEVFKGLPDRFVSVGKDLIHGLWQGISNSYTWIKNKISGWVGDIFSFLKNLFGIHSPSTKTAYQGKMLGMGLAKGIIGSKGEVFKAVNGITKMTTGSFEAGLNVRAVGSLASQEFGASLPAAQTWPGDVTTEIRALGDRIEHMQVSLDGKKVVGGIVTDMRYELGLQEDLAKRGVIK